MNIVDRGEKKIYEMYIILSLFFFECLKLKIHYFNRNMISFPTITAILFFLWLYKHIMS